LVQESRASENKPLTSEERQKRKVLVNTVLKSLAEYPLQRIERMENGAVEKVKKRKKELEELKDKDLSKTEKHKNEKELVDYKDIDVYGPQFVQDNITQLLLDLHAYNRLPALVFCLDRIQCEELMVRI